MDKIKLEAHKVGKSPDYEFKMVYHEGVTWVVWASLLGNYRLGDFPFGSLLKPLLVDLPVEVTEGGAVKAYVDNRECWIIKTSLLVTMLENRSGNGFIGDFIADLKNVYITQILEIYNDLSESPALDEFVSESPQVQNTETEEAGDSGVVAAELDPVYLLIKEEFSALAHGFRGWSKSISDDINVRMAKFEEELGIGPGHDGSAQPLPEFTVIVEDDRGEKVYQQKVKNLDLVRMILFVNNLQMNTNAPPSVES